MPVVDAISAPSSVAAGTTTIVVHPYSLRLVAA
jgi:hypothetical protein